MPGRAEFDDFVIELDSDAAAHTDDEAFTFERARPFFEVSDQIFGDGLDAAFRADDGFDGGRAGFQALALGGLFGFGDLFESGIELRDELFIESNAGQTGS